MGVEVTRGSEIVTPSTERFNLSAVGAAPALAGGDSREEYDYYEGNNALHI